MRFSTFAAVSALVSAAPASAATHADLVALYARFRADVKVPVRAGVPDHSPAAMTARRARAQSAIAELQRIDDSRWPIPERADWMLALAEMRGVEFEHRVLRQWQRDPSWWATLDIGWGPKISTAFAPPKLPISDKAERARFSSRLRAVPATLEAARASLTDMRSDLVKLGLLHHRIETRLYQSLAGQLRRHHPDLAGDAERARAASATFTAWMEHKLPALPQKAGIGKENFDWYLRHVLLFPYSFDEMRVLGDREWERSISFLRIEEHEHRSTPMVEPVASLAGFEALRREADTDLLEFLKRKRIMTVPEWLSVPEPEGPYVMPQNQDPARGGPFDAPIQRNFFREAEDRDPRSLRAHNLPGHIFDTQYRKRDKRPLRGGDRLGFIDSSRLEGWAFYLEEMLLQAGWLDTRPKAREIHYVLQANRAARLRAELLAHSNDWTFDQSLGWLTSRTPKWMELSDDTALYDMALYLRQPGLGLNYYFGKLQIEQLLAEVAQTEGADFDLQRFHDRFIASGVIPIALTRWEMTGKDDQVKMMR
jgi:uncharacterized protein (DUF885 family)